MEVFTESEACRMLKISRLTLRRHRLSGKIQAVRFGKHSWLYTREALEDWRMAHGEQVAARQAIISTASSHA